MKGSVDFDFELWQDIDRKLIDLISQWKVNQLISCSINLRLNMINNDCINFGAIASEHEITSDTSTLEDWKILDKLRTDI